MGEFVGHENSLENSLRFAIDPMTLNRGGEWESFSICRLVVSSVTEEHQTWNDRNRD